VVPYNGLAAATYTATVTVSGGNGIAANFDVSFTVNPAIYGINLDVTGTHTFPAAIAGYGTQTAKSVTIDNTGNQATGALTAALSGDDSGSFTLSTTAIPSIAVGETDTFTVAPNTGLAAGTYTATVTVNGENSITADFDVSFTVNPSIGTGNITIGFNEGGEGAFSQTSFTIWKGGAATKTISLSGSGSWSGQIWYVGTKTVGTGTSITLNAANYSVGNYMLSVTVKKGYGAAAVYWSKAITFTVE
jgi:hypothetical protein